MTEFYRYEIKIQGVKNFGNFMQAREEYEYKIIEATVIKEDDGYLLDNGYSTYYSETHSLQKRWDSCLHSTQCAPLYKIILLKSFSKEIYVVETHSVWRMDPT